MAEVIREPSYPCHSSELFPVERLTQQESPGKGLSGSEIVVAFCPAAAHGLQSAFLDIPFDLLIESRVVLLYEVVHGRLALNHLEVGIFPEQGNHLAEIVVRHLDRFPLCPQPVHVHVAVTCHKDGVFLRLGTPVHRCPGHTSRNPGSSRQERCSQKK